MRYDTILFDADDTLLDFKQAEAVALKKVFSAYGYAFDDRVNDKYQAINQGLWKDLENGLITKDIITETRFATLFSQLGIEGDGIAFNRSYIKELAEGGYILEGARELCEELSKSARLYLVTNGISKTQRRRIAKAGVGRYFTDIFISEEVGFQKPQKGFFDYVFAKIHRFNPERTIIVGDSLTSDITGGKNAGIDTCWYNPEGKDCGGLIPTYEIERLELIHDICRNSPIQPKAAAEIV